MQTNVEKILNLFEEINKVPRCSKNEDAISKWLVEWAKDSGFEALTDSIKNVLIKVPGSEGFENRETVVFQGHMDMVCEKTPGSDHDFQRDPIKHITDGDWLTADRTTLGADNGIALAIAMVAATDENLVHPPMELLFTVDEETGLTGANAIEPGWLEGKILLNLDSEDEGVFTVGCAGGKDTKISMKLDYEEAPENMKAYKVSVGGLQGGHSGVDINQPKGNANIIIARLISEIFDNFDIRLASIKGGSAHNAIPRDAEALLYSDSYPGEVAAKIEKVFKSDFSYEKNLAVTVEEVEVERRTVSKMQTEKLIDLFLALPHGVAEMSQDIEGLVETSNNFATIEIEDGTLKILTSQRSSVMSKLNALTKKIESVARLSGAEYKSGNGYPSWEPDMDSPLLDKCKNIYSELFGKEPVVEIIHAGLECGIIGAKNEGMDMISYGPTIKNPHSPDEKMEIPSLSKIWQFTVALLKSYC